MSQPVATLALARRGGAPVVRFARRWRWLILAAIALFPFLGARGLNEPDEGRYAEIGREMAEGGSWLVPHLNGFGHFQKPPLVYWFTAGSIRLFGANEWAARLPSALAALGTAALLFVMGKRLLGRERGEIAAIVAVSSAEFFLLAHILTPDMLLTWWTTAAVAAFVFRRRWLFFACIGLGFLTKGPMALVVPICAAAGWQLAAEPDERRQFPWKRGLPLALAIGLAWFAALSLWNRELFGYFWRYELLERFASHTHGRSKPLWFFLPVLLAGFLPWTFFLFPTVPAAWRRWREGRLAPWHGMLLGWTLGPLCLLSLSGSKLPTYVLPLFPALALAVAARIRAPARAWRIAGTAVLCGTALAAFAPRANGLLRQQASVRTLAAVLRTEPGNGKARVFSCEVRAHGLEFYLRRRVAATRADSDIVLSPDPAERRRLFDSPEECERAFALGPPAFGIVRRARFAASFPPECWSVLARAGDFLLISNRHPRVAGSAKPQIPLGHFHGSL